jgi:hypothetical protein
MISIDLEEFEQIMKYLQSAAGTDMFKHWLKMKWRMTLEFQTQGA